MWEQWLALAIVGFLILVWVFHNLQFFVRIRNNARSLYRWAVKNDSTLDFTVPLKHPRVLKRTQVITLTAAPQRIQYLAKNFSSISMSQVHTIYLNLPKLFRNKEPQDASELEVLQKLVPKLQILWQDVDTGPDMKILGSLDTIQKNFEDPQVIIMDDDTLQKNVLLDDQDRGWDKIQSENNWTRSKVVLSAQVQRLFGFELALGFASYCYRMRDLVDNGLSKFKDLCKMQRECDYQCKRHDDFTVSAAFEDCGFRVVQTSTGHPLQLDIGFQADALHQMIPAEIKHYKCSDAIWTSRQQSPNKQFNLYEKGLKWYSEVAE